MGSVTMTIRGFGDGKYLLDDGSGNIIAKYPQEIGLKPPPTEFYDGPTQALRQQEPSGGAGIGAALERGAYESADIGGATMRFFGAEDTGRAISDWAQQKASQLPQTEGTVEEAARMLPSSMVFPMAMQVASYPAALVPVVGPALSMVMKGLAWSYPALMGAAQFQQTKEAAIEKGVDPGAAPFITGGMETAGEILPMMLFNRFLPFAPVMRQLGKAAGKELTKLPLKELGKRAGVAIGADVGGEMATSLVQGATERSYGIRPEADPFQEMLDVAGPSALLSIGTAGLVGGGNYMSSNMYNKILASPVKEDDKFQLRKDARKISAASVTDAIGASGDEEASIIAKKWHDYAMGQIENNLPIDMDNPILDVVNHVHKPIDLTKPREVEESAIGTPFKADYESASPTYDEDVSAFMPTATASPYSTSVQPTYDEDVSEALSRDFVPQPQVPQTQAAILPDNVGSPDFNIPQVSAGGAVPFWGGQQGQAIMNQPVTMNVRENVIAPSQPWYGANIDVGGVSQVPSMPGQAPVVSAQQVALPMSMPVAPQKQTPAVPDVAAPMRKLLNPNDIPAERIPVIFADMEEKARELNGTREFESVMRYIRNESVDQGDIDMGRNMFIAMLDSAGYDLPKGATVQDYEKVAKSIRKGLGIKTPLKKGKKVNVAPAPIVPSVPIEKVVKPLKKGKIPGAKVPQEASEGTTERGAIDYKTASMFDLHVAAANIIGKHLKKKLGEERGSISWKKAGDDTLYNQLKPIFDELVARAKKIGTDIEGFVRGWIHSQEGTDQDTIDTMTEYSDRYLWDMDTAGEKEEKVVPEKPVTKGQDTKKTGKKMYIPADVEKIIAEKLKNKEDVSLDDARAIAKNMLNDDDVILHGENLISANNITEKNDEFAYDIGLYTMMSNAQGMATGKKKLVPVPVDKGVVGKVNKPLEKQETAEVTPEQIAKKMINWPKNNRNEKSARKFIEELEGKYYLDKAKKALEKFATMKKWETGQVNGLTQDGLAQMRLEAWEAIANEIEKAKKISGKEKAPLKTVERKKLENVPEKGKQEGTQEKVPAKESVPKSTVKSPLTFEQWVEQEEVIPWDSVQYLPDETKEDLRARYETYRKGFTVSAPAPKVSAAKETKKESDTITKERSESTGTTDKRLASVLRVGMSADKLTEVWTKLVAASKASKMDAKAKEAIDVFMNDPKSAGYGSGEMLTLIKAAGYKLDDNLNLKKIALQLKSATGYKPLHEKKTVTKNPEKKAVTEDKVARVAEEAAREQASTAEVEMSLDEFQKKMDETVKEMSVKGLKVGNVVRYGLYHKGNRINNKDYHTIEEANASKKGEARRIAQSFISDKYDKDYSFIKSKASGVTGFSIQNAKDHIDRLRNVWNSMPKVNIHGNFNSLPSFIRHDIIKQQGENAGNVVGFLYAGEVYVIANKVIDTADLEMIMAHEVVGHYGIEEVLGDQFEPMMLGIYDSFKNDARMKWLVAYNGTKNMDKDEGKINAAKEFVAELATGYRLDKPTLPRKVLNAVRTFLRKFGFKTKWTDRDIERILSASRIFITTEPKRVYASGQELNSRGYSYMMKMPDVVQALGSSENSLANAALAFGRTLRSFGPDKTDSISYKEQYLASPEWFQNKVLHTLFEIAMKRSDLFHENFHRYIAILDGNGTDTGKNVLELNKDLTKISLWSKLKGMTDSEQRRSVEQGKKWAAQRDEIIDTMSASDGMIKWDDWTDFEGRHHAGYKHKIARTHSKEVYDMVDALRKSYDRVIDEQIAELNNMREMLNKEAEETGVQVKQPTFPSYNEEGKAIYLTLDEAIKAFGNWRGSYAPRIRTGRYVFAAARTVNGQRELWREQGNSKTKLNYTRIQMQKQGWECEEVEAVERLPEVVNASLRYVDIQALLDKSFARMDKEKNKEGGEFTPTQKEMMYMMHGDMIMSIRDELLSRGFRSHGMKRRTDVLIGGYEKDALKQAVTYFANFASGKAKIETAKQMAEAIKPKWENGKYIKGVGIVPQKDPKTWNVAHKYIQHQLRNADDLDRIINRAKQIISVKYLGLSLRAPIVNITSLFITAPSATYTVLTDAGINTKFKEIMPALKNGMSFYTRFMIDHYSGKESDWMKGRFGRTDREFFERMTKSGWDNQQFTSAAMGGITSTSLGNAFDNSVSFAMSLFGKSEQMIRGTVLYAGFTLAAKSRGLYDMTPGSEEYKKTFEECCKLSEDCSLRANAAYNRPSDPLWTMGDHPMAKLGQLYYMYMKFPHNFLQLLYHTGIRRKHYKAAAWMLAAPVALSGAVTFPFYNTLAAFSGMILRAFFDEDRDPEKLMREKLEGMFGKDATGLLLSGVLGSAGIDISSSLSVGVEKPSKWTDAIGVMGGALGDLQEAMRQLSIGNYLRAFSKLTPNLVSSNLKSLLEMEGGVMTDKAQPLFDEKGAVVKPTSGEALLRMFTGTEPFRIAEIKRRTYQGKKQLLTMKAKRDKLMEKYRLYWSGVKKDPEYLSEIMTDIRAYNEKVKRYGGSKNTGMAEITLASLKSQREKFTKTNKKALQLFYENP